MEDKPSFIYCSNTHKHTHTEEERDQLTLSSFSCDVIEAEQQTLKPGAELRPSTTAKNYRLHSRSAHTHISTGHRGERGRGEGERRGEERRGWAGEMYSLR